MGNHDTINSTLNNATNNSSINVSIGIDDIRKQIIDVFNQLDKEMTKMVEYPGIVQPIKHRPCIPLFQENAKRLLSLAASFNEIITVNRENEEENEGDNKGDNDITSQFFAIDLNELQHTLDKEVELLRCDEKLHQKGDKGDEMIRIEMFKVTERLKRNVHFTHNFK